MLRVQWVHGLGDWAERAWPCSLTKSLETWLVSSSRRDRRARGNSWSSGERGAEEAALCRLPEHWEAGRTGLSNFYCHYCMLIPLQRIGNRSCLRLRLLTLYCQKSLGFPTLPPVQHRVGYSPRLLAAPFCCPAMSSSGTTCLGTAAFNFSVVNARHYNMI